MHLLIRICSTIQGRFFTEIFTLASVEPRNLTLPRVMEAETTCLWDSANETSPQRTKPGKRLRKSQPVIHVKLSGAIVRERANHHVQLYRRRGWICCRRRQNRPHLFTSLSDLQSYQDASICCPTAEPRLAYHRDLDSVSTTTYPSVSATSPYWPTEHRRMSLVSPDARKHHVGTSP